MDNLKQVINLLRSIESTMDTISVVGIDYQDKFVGCAQAVRTAGNHISDYIASVEACAEKKDEVPNAGFAFQ